MTEPVLQAPRPRRSLIFTPGLRSEMFPKALACGTDIVCVELEDGIEPKDKDAARKSALALFEKEQANDVVERMVRINCLRDAFGLADVQAILASNSPPPALMLPKVNTPEEVEWLDDLLTERGHPTRLHVIIETFRGLQAAFEIAQSSARIDALFFGGVDMAAELRCENAWEPLLYARSRVVHAAANAGVDVIDVPYLDLEDAEGMVVEARKVKACDAIPAWAHTLFLGCTVRAFSYNANIAVGLINRSHWDVDTELLIHAPTGIRPGTHQV